jgi:hypothetical protein
MADGPICLFLCLVARPSLVVCVFASFLSFYSSIDSTFFPQLVYIYAIPAFGPRVGVYNLAALQIKIPAVASSQRTCCMRRDIL